MSLIERAAKRLEELRRAGVDIPGGGAGQSNAEPVGKQGPFPIDPVQRGLLKVESASHPRGDSPWCFGTR